MRVASVCEDTAQLQPSQSDDLLGEVRDGVAWGKSGAVEAGVDLDQRRDAHAQFARGAR